MAYEKTWQFDTNRRYVPANVPRSTVTSAIFSAGGGTLSTTTYFYAVTAIKNNVESVVGGETSVDSTSGGTMTVTWTAVAGASSYNVYRGTSSQAYNRIFALGNVLTFVDTGSNGAAVGNLSIPYSPGPDWCKYTLWYYKAFISGQIGGASLGLWTIIGSSDSVTGAMDGVDRWGSIYDPQKIIGNSEGNAHSWVALQSPVMAGKTFYIVFNYNGAATGYYNFAFTMGATAPVGGTVTAAPTFGVTATISSSFLGLNHTASFGSFRMHGQLATDGSFNILSSKNGTRQFVAGTLCHLLANYRVTDLYPVVINNSSAAIGLTTGYGEQIGASPSGTGPDGLGYNAMLTQNGGGADLYAWVLPGTANWPSGEDIYDKTFPDYPCWVSKRATGNGFVGTRGRVQDVVLTSGLYASGTGPASFGQGPVDDQFSPKYVTVGNFRFPINTPIIWQ